MSGCIGCANQPSDNGSLGGAGHEGTVTPMVIGIIIGTVAIFVLVVCALFYCVKLENNKYTAKIGDSGGGGSGSEQAAVDDGADSGESSESVKSRPSSVVVMGPPGVGGGGAGGGGATVGVREVGASVGGAGGGPCGRGEGKRRLFAWGRKSALPSDNNSPVTAIEMV